jgi:hypothetical protein
VPPRQASTTFESIRTAWVLPAVAGGLAAIALGAFLAQAEPQRGFLLAVGAVAAISLGLVTLARPAVGALLLVAVVPITSGIQRGVPVPGYRLSEVLIIGLGGVILLTARPTQRVPWRAFDWLALLYAVTTALFGAYDLAGRGAEFSTENVGKLFGPLQFFVLYRAVLTALSSSRHRQLAVKLAVIATIPVAALAILQQLDLVGARAFAQRLTGADPALLSLNPAFVLGERASGPFPAWHTLGGYLFLAILLGVGLLLDRSVSVIRTSVLVPVLALAGLALVLTLTAAPILGVILGSVALGVWLRRFGRVAVVVAFALSASVLLFTSQFERRYEQQFGSGGLGVPQTLSFRFDVWTEQYLPFLSSRLATGYGPDSPQLDWGYAESVYVSMLLRGGLPLLLVYLALTLALVTAAHRRVSGSDPLQRLVGRVLVLALVMLAFMHFVSSYFITSGLPHLLWVLAGVLLAADRSTVPVDARAPKRAQLSRRPVAVASPP